jgi:hypothetical protein
LQNEKIADDQSLESTLSPAPLLLQPCRSHQQDQANVPFNSFLLARNTEETYQLHESGVLMEQRRTSVSGQRMKWSKAE